MKFYGYIFSRLHLFLLFSFFQLPSSGVRGFICIFLATSGLMDELFLRVNYKVKAVDANLSREAWSCSASSLRHRSQ